MIRSRAAIAVAACVAGVLGSSIAAAQADSGATGATGTTGTTPASTIVVNGSATTTVAAGASSSVISAAYLGELSTALTNAHTKATALSSAVGDKLGAVQNITEQSNDTGLCSGPMVFEKSSGAAKGAPSATPVPKKHRKPHKVTTKSALVRVADDTPSTCTVEADMTVTYAMAPA